MIKKITLERDLVFAMSSTIIESFKITGCSSVRNLTEAIFYGVNRFENYRCRVLQDTDGEAYFVPREGFFEPEIEIRDYHMESAEFINEQEKIPFNFEEGELVRFIVEDMGTHMNLRIAEAHLAGDGRSLLMLAEEILTYLDEIEAGTFDYVAKPMKPIVQFSKEYLDEKLEINELLKCSLDEYNKAWNKQKKVYSYQDFEKYFNMYWENYSTSIKTMRIGKEELDALLALGREHKVSLNNMLVTACAREIEEARKMFVVVDARTAEHTAVGNYYGGFEVEGLYDSNKDFWENAKYIQNQVSAKLTRKEDALFGRVIPTLLDCNLVDAIALNASGNYDNEVAQAYNDLYSMKKANFGVAVTNLGAKRIREDYDCIKLEETELSSPLFAGANCVLGVVTSNGIMNVTMSYNKVQDIDYEAMLEGVECFFSELVHSNVEETERAEELVLAAL